MLARPMNGKKNVNTLRALGTTSSWMLMATTHRPPNGKPMECRRFGPIAIQEKKMPHCPFPFFNYAWSWNPILSLYYLTKWRSCWRLPWFHISYHFFLFFSNVTIYEPRYIQMALNGTSPQWGARGWRLDAQRHGGAIKHQSCPFGLVLIRKHLFIFIDFVYVDCSCSRSNNWF
jgi:hypothetical protein